jgi:hypothetical protein
MRFYGRSSITVLSGSNRSSKCQKLVGQVKGLFIAGLSFSVRGVRSDFFGEKEALDSVLYEHGHTDSCVYCHPSYERDYF